MTSLAYERVTEYGERPVPSSLSSAFTALTRPAIRSLYAVEAAAEWATGEPMNEDLKNSVALMDYQMSHPDFSTSQTVTNTIAGLAGHVLDPVGLLMGGIGGEIVGGAVSKGIGYVPEFVSAITAGALSKESIAAIMTKAIPAFENNKFARYLPKNFHEVLEREAQSAGLMAGFTLPESFIENYNADTGRLDYGGLVRSTAFNGGIGLAIPPLAWTAGVIIGKMGVKGFEELSSAQKINKAAQALEKGAISKEEHDWLVNLYEKPHETDAHIRGAMGLLDKENHPVNAFTGKIELPFMTQDELKQMQTFALDQMASGNGQDYKRALSDFVTHKMLDRMTTMMDENPSLITGIKAHIDATESRLAKRIEQLEKDDIYVERTTPRSVTRKQPISQQKLYNMMKEGKLSEREMPFIIPENITTLRNQENKIARLEQTSKNYEKEFNKTNRAKFKKAKDKVDAKLNDERASLEKMHKESHKILTQAEELKAIESKLLGKKELPKNYMLKKEYLRLLDLAHVYPQANGLLRRIALREQYELQAAYNEVLKGIVKIAEEGMGRFAKPERVINYFKERIETSADIESYHQFMMDEIKKVREEAKVYEAVDYEQESMEKQFNAINDNPNISTEVKDQFNLSYSRLKQFKGNSEALESLVKCVMEAENVTV